MITKYYVDASGNYIGGFQGAAPPAGSIEVPTAPAHALDKFTNGAWVKNLTSLKQEVSAKRYAVEVAGINFTYRTVPTPVSTSRETRGSMLGAYNSAVAGRWAVNPATENDFKFGDGIFRPATNQEVIDIYLLVEAHIKACYGVEGQKFAEIDATGTTDVNTGWPATANSPTTIYFGK